MVVNAKDWRLTNSLARPLLCAALEALMIEYRKQLTLKHIFDCTMAKVLEKLTLFLASLVWRKLRAVLRHVS